MRFLVLLALVLCISAGCVRRQYKVTLRNNQVIRTTNRPKLDKETGTYRFKDASGQQVVIPASRVREIEIR